jgi:hypothetical protein
MEDIKLNRTAELRTAVHLPPCTRNKAHTNTWCCHNTHHNEIFIHLISDFSQEIYVLPDDDMQCGIETFRSNESVLMCLILDYYMIYI